jgi:ATP-dependent protease ClpP protease subunit
MMDNCECPVEIIATGHVMSAGVPILMCGTQGYRAATKNCLFMCHNSITGAEGNYNDLMAEAGMIDSLDKRLKNIALTRTKITKKKYAEMDLATSYYFDAKEALKLGIIDYII